MHHREGLRGRKREGGGKETYEEHCGSVQFQFLFAKSTTSPMFCAAAYESAKTRRTTAFMLYDIKKINRRWQNRGEKFRGKGGEREGESGSPLKVKNSRRSAREKSLKCFVSYLGSRSS